MRRLYQQIYLSILLILFIFAVLIVTTTMVITSRTTQAPFTGIGAVVQEFIFPADQDPAVLVQTTEKLAKLLDADVTIEGRSGGVLASVGAPISLSHRHADEDFSYRPGSSVAILLPDHRLVLIAPKTGLFGAMERFFVAIAALTIAIGFGALPLARKITRRLERLKTRVEALGAGDLTSRVSVEGKDEVAELARSFNRTADQIERLVTAQQHVLAGVSHEIRTPLSRMRVALDLIDMGDRPELREKFIQDLAELDDLIGEMLMVSRLEAFERPPDVEDVDLLAIAVEEGARTDAVVTGVETSVRGDRFMLRRLVRNLLENAQRYAAGARVDVVVGPLASGGAELTVTDQGAGVDPAEVEKIFEPFYRSKTLTDNTERHIGLGLSLVRRIARSHGGDVACKPLPEGGTIFEVHLTGAATHLKP